MIDMLVSTVSHGFAAFGFSVLAILLIAARGRTSQAWLLCAVAITTALWAAASAALPAGPLRLLPSVLDVVRTGAWLLFLASLTLPAMRSFQSPTRRGVLAGFVALCVIVPVVLDSALVWRTGQDPIAMVGALSVLSRLLLTVLGLLAVENLFRNAGKESRWGIKHLCLAAGGVFVFDFYLFADALLLSRPDEELLAARGAVNAIMVPLLAIAGSRNRSWSLDIHVSRGAIFHTATVVGSGLFLVVMAAAGFYLRNVGGEWGALIQIAFLFGAAVLMLVAVLSEAVRANLRLFIAKNFFSYTYDYRYEWHRFINTIDSGSGRLHDRVIRAVANIVDSPGGVLWVRWRDEDAFHPAAVWNCPPNLPNLALASPLLDFIAERRWIVDLREWRAEPERYGGLALPDGIEALPRAWLIVPFLHQSEVRGILVLNESRALRKLNWEDLDLLKTVGRQVASYLAEEDAMRALVDAQQLQDFNRRFAFVVHDIKNVAGQLALVAKNAERHGDNPEFQQDAMATLRNAADKMLNMLDALDLERREISDRDRERLEPVELSGFLRDVVKPWSHARPCPHVRVPDGEVHALADRDKLSAVAAHLIQNAIEAVGPDGHIEVRIAGAVDEAVIEVVDDGPGMDPAFVRDQLFRPLRTTKGSGYGIGAYQTRELVKEMDGRLEVVSAVGQGTTMRIVLRAAETGPPGERAAQASS